MISVKKSQVNISTILGHKSSLFKYVKEDTISNNKDIKFSRGGGKTGVYEINE